MISDTTYEKITTIADQYVPDSRHPELHVNSRDAWVDLIMTMVDKDLIKPRMMVLLKCALNWEALLTLKFSRLN